MKGSSLALLLAPKKGGEESDDESSDDEGSGDSDYQAFAEAAFPDEDWTAERVNALKQFVMACMEK